MLRTFVESSQFRKFVDSHGGDALLRSIQNEILKNPAAGDVMPGAGGVRKLRIRGSGRGKRSGIRVLYLDLPAARTTHLLVGFGKNRKSDLSAAERTAVCRLASAIKEAAL